MRVLNATGVLHSSRVNGSFHIEGDFSYTPPFRNLRYMVMVYALLLSKVVKGLLKSENCPLADESTFLKRADVAFGLDDIELEAQKRYTKI